MNPRPVIETERLVLRPLGLGDADTITRLAGDRAIADTTLRIPHPYPEGLAAEWIATHPEEWQEGRGVTLGITLKQDGSLAGVIGLMGSFAGEVAELGYWIAVPLWNQGYATEAARAVLAFGFQELNLARIHACHLTRNLASGRVLEKIGMRHEGRRPRHVRKWDKLEDLELFGALRKEPEDG